MGLFTQHKKKKRFHLPSLDLHIVCFLRDISPGIWLNLEPVIIFIYSAGGFLHSATLT